MRVFRDGVGDLVTGGTVTGCYTRTPIFAFFAALSLNFVVSLDKPDGPSLVT